MINLFTIQINYTFFINLGVLFFVFFTTLAHFITPKGYNWRETTLSNLAIKGYKNAWVMRVAFILLGFLVVLGVILKIKETGIFWGDIFVILYGIGTFLTGALSTSPEGITGLFNKFEDITHSILAYISSILLVIGMFFYAIKTQGDIRLIHMYFLDLAGVISLLFFISKNNTNHFEHGVVQRGVILIGLSWILLNYNFLI